MKHLHLKIFGNVQDVCYRMYAQKMAQELGLVGWVKNYSDGIVEVDAEKGVVRKVA